MVINSKDLFKRAAAILMCSLIVAGVFAIVANAENADVAFTGYDDGYLPTYLGELAGEAWGTRDFAANISGDGAEVCVCVDENGKSYHDTLLLDTDAAVAEYSVNITESGLYNIELTYLLDAQQSNNLSFGLNIDGKTQFDEMQSMVLPRYWTNQNGIRKDDFGNQITPKQVSALRVTSRRLLDFSGSEKYPYMFYFSEGEHTITIKNASVSVNIIFLAVKAPEYLLSYEKTLEQYRNNGYKEYSGKKIAVEGESAVYKSSRSLIAKSDRRSPNLSPASATLDLLNYIGGTSWQAYGDEIIWQVDVPESGLYKLGFAYLQNTVINGISYRELRINGAIPFREAASVRFAYNTKWNYTGFTDKNGDDYLVYLEKGKQEISLGVTLGDSYRAYNDLKDIISELGDLYIDITVITGESPDVNRDYELFKKIPNWEDRLKAINSSLESLADNLRSLSGKQGSTIIAASDNMARVINNMLNNPYTAQIYVGDYYNCYTTLSSWLFEMKQMPLGIDVIDIYAPDSGLQPKDVGFFKSVIFGVKRFLASFASDYNSLSKKSNSEHTLKIWVNWGRDQALVLNNLIQESFSEYAERELGYKVNVNLELVNASLVKGILSNNAPDLALHMSRTEPVNLAIRRAICDLSEFPDFNEVIKRFGDTATVPYQYNGGTYALPDQQTFFLMFYRKDILDQLGLSIPKTWDEFLAATAVLQRNNMNSYIPYVTMTSETTVNTGLGSLSLYPTILSQFGGSFYNKNLNRCTLDEQLSVSAFKYWIEMYTQYKLPTEANFYNRFRLGISPIGISSYTLYNTLSQAAPEIEGRWGIALVPGIKDKTTGEINRSVAGGGSGCAILAGSKHKDEAWAFLKWWTLAQTQLDYNNNVESILGSTARIPLATKEAFENLSWKDTDLIVLKQEFSLIEEINEVPGSYYVTRAVDQAFWNVISGGRQPKDVLIEWGTVANEEIARKIKEYS